MIKIGQIVMWAGLAVAALGFLVFAGNQVYVYATAPAGWFDRYTFGNWVFYIVAPFVMAVPGLIIALIGWTLRLMGRVDQRVTS
ncbi:hypothetical protein [Nesterenkonia populi]|uniref:hypothetical protein n=1 Tax=Nesterenkonia populi TaxID=1591087 RepID=UPI0011BD5762|nr:hypothetical protein [Nesterenkonia populi]